MKLHERNFWFKYLKSYKNNANANNDNPYEETSYFVFSKCPFLFFISLIVGAIFKTQYVNTIPAKADTNPDCPYDV